MDGFFDLNGDEMESQKLAPNALEIIIFQSFDIRRSPPHLAYDKNISGRKKEAFSLQFLV